MKVIVREEAFADLAGIRAVIADDRPGAADDVVGRILASFDRLASFPRMGRSGAVPGTREWVVRGLPYIVVYRVDARADELTVVAVFHGAQKRTKRRPRSPR